MNTLNSLGLASYKNRSRFYRETDRPAQSRGGFSCHGPRQGRRARPPTEFLRCGAMSATGAEPGLWRSVEICDQRRSNIGVERLNAVAIVVVIDPGGQRGAAFQRGQHFGVKLETQEVHR